MDNDNRNIASTRSCPHCNKVVRGHYQWCPECGATIEMDKMIEERQEIFIGRDTECDMVLTWPQVSRKHARIFRSETGLFIEDLGSANGTFSGDFSNRLEQNIPHALKPSDTIYVGPHKLNLTNLANFGFIEFGGRGKNKAEAPKSLQLSNIIRIGRATNNDMVMNHPQISAYHARMVMSAEGYVLEDLDSTNGTFVNGKLTQNNVVHVGDVIGIGPYILRIGTDGLLHKEDSRGDIRMDAKDIFLQVKDRSTGNPKTLLENISLCIYPREFVGLMGPAGAGKTTLLMALNGFSRPQRGNVLINGHDFYEHYNCYRGNIGYVTQDDILYKQLTVRKALYYTARLRLPLDVTDEEIMTNIEDILKELRMEDKIDTLIGSPEHKVLSGGQRKRVNLAQELITQPTLLFLDEPTSGLAALDAEEVMDTLVRLAQHGRTIILTIHQPSLRNYQKMSHVIYLTVGGKLAYFGPTDPDSFSFFETKGEKDPDLIIRNLMTRKPEEWQEKYKKSDHCADFVHKRHATDPHTTGAKTEKPEPLRVDAGYQFKILTRRCFEVKLKDTVNTLILLLQAPIIAALMAWVFRDAVNEKLLNPLFLLSIVAFWFGCSNSAREIVSEQAIYRRERMVNLLIPTYLLSKLVVLAGLCAIQCAILAGVTRIFIDFTGSFVLTFLVLLLTAIAGLATGLVLSAFVKTEEAAISLVPIILIPQVILGGLLVKLPLHGDIEVISHLMICKWSFAGLLAIESNRWDVGVATDRLWLVILVIIIYLTLMSALSGWLLKRKD